VLQAIELSYTNSAARAASIATAKLQNIFSPRVTFHKNSTGGSCPGNPGNFAVQIGN
jgi:hypothetical protein